MSISIAFLNFVAIFHVVISTNNFASYKSFYNENITSYFKINYLVNTIKVNAKYQCLAACNKNDSCLSVAYEEVSQNNNDDNCFIFNEDPLSVLALVNSSFVSVHVKKFASVNDNCAYTPCAPRGDLICDINKKCVCPANKTWSTLDSNCIYGAMNMACSAQLPCDSSLGLSCISGFCKCQMAISYSGSCPNNGKYDSKGYCIYNTKVAWSYADSFCKCINMTLIIINNQTELAYVKSKISGMAEFWVGFSYDTPSAQWLWQDGRIFPPVDPLWDLGVQGHDLTFLCGVIHKAGGLCNHLCSNLASYVCEMK